MFFCLCFILVCVDCLCLALICKLGSCCVVCLMGLHCVEEFQCKCFKVEIEASHDFRRFEGSDFIASPLSLTS